MDTKRYLKTEITSVEDLRKVIKSCKGTITVTSDTGYMHLVFRHCAGGWDLFYQVFKSIFVYSPTPHGCTYIGEFTDLKFRFTEKSEVTKYSAEFRVMRYIERVLNNEIPQPKLKFYVDSNMSELDEDQYADKVFNFRGIETND